MASQSLQILYTFVLREEKVTTFDTILAEKYNNFALGKFTF